MEIPNLIRLIYCSPFTNPIRVYYETIHEVSGSVILEGEIITNQYNVRHKNVFIRLHKDYLDVFNNHYEMYEINSELRYTAFFKELEELKIYPDHESTTNL